ncbi:MAG: aminotransferase class I/II-fold pyridoxal phosphate-dependent enzyme [Actinomycetia bacterium]|nr:aminotransferase class I/II-fold pyridoxal phosphate-dependent enzyme [Actinomycetes bacterium]MCP4222354.1 aminotransferase class I/II-fold pyridoxal phosphate-dependent enzyme [Actinomycetes bacterium]MCP5033048.1 aminotransferase class I/II-fold pyridoxal phosphate-dependent enzyme [Actinomycetes bacterium]
MLRPKPGLAAIQDYQAGRSSELVKEQLGLTTATGLASNEISEGPLPGVAELLAEHLGNIHRYPEVRSATLARAIAAKHSIDVSRVAVGPGSAGLLFQFSHAFMTPSSTLVVPTPTFDGYPLAAAVADATYVPVPLRNHQVDVEAVMSAVSPETGAIVLAEPNNPTGTALGREPIEWLIEQTAGRCFLILDEAYFEFNSHPDRVNGIEVASAQPHVVVLRTFSKAYGLAGMRVGYAVGDAEVCSYLNRVAPPFSVNALAQKAALASLDLVDELNSRICRVVAERQRLVEALRGVGLKVPDPYGNFIFIDIADPESLASQLEQRGVVTRPISGHGLRVTIGMAAENDRFLGAIRSIFDPR